MMKKFAAISMAAIMAMSMTACGESKTETTEAPETTETTATSAVAAAGDIVTVNEGKLTMSTNAEFPPYEMTTDAGDFEGIDVEIAGAIAEYLGLELQVDDMGFDAALLAAQQGKSDIIMAGVSVTEDRLAVMDFSDTYATAVQVVIVKEDSDITIDDLGDLQIGCQNATTGDIYCKDDYGEDHVTSYDNGASAIQALKNGQIDCVVIDNAPAQAYVASTPGLKILETEYVTEEYAIGLAKDSALTPVINEALAALTEDGTIQAIIDKYITE